MNHVPGSGPITDFRAFEATPGVHVILSPQESDYPIVAASNDFIALTTLRRADVVGRTYFAFFAEHTDEIQPTEKQKIRASFEKVVRDRSSDDIDLLRFDIGVSGEKLQPRCWSVKNTPILTESGQVLYIIHSITDIAERIDSGNRPESVRSMEKAYKFFMNTPGIIGYVRGDNYIIELANEGLLRVWGRTREVLGKPLLEAIPELADQGIKQLLDNVRQTGEPFYAYGHPLLFNHEGREETLYFDFVYQPFYEDEENKASGVVSVGYDVTPQVLATKQAEDSRQKWRQLADTMPAIVWTGDAKGNIDFLNHRWYEFTGLSTEESIRFGWTSVVHPDDFERCMKSWNEALEREVFYEVEVRYRSREGAYRWMIARGVPIKENGKVIAWYGTSSDIHDQKQLELYLEEKVRERTEELESKNILLDNILRHSSNGISVSEMIFDSSGEVCDALTILANEAAVNFSGIPREIYLSRKASELDPGIIASPYGQMCIKTLQTGEPSIMQYFVEFSARWLELTVSRMDDCHLIHIFTDVTSIKQAQLQLEKSLEELKFANANLEEFAYATSHDLKEPVRKIHFFSNRLKEELKDKLNETQVMLFRRLESTSLRMGKLIEDLLEYSQAAQGPGQSERIDLGAQIKSVLEDLELEIQKKQARILVGSLPEIRGNRRQIQQLFQNLIGNALKYARPDVIPEIHVVSRFTIGKDVGRELPPDALARKFCLIDVADNGVGFDPRDADLIFKVFTRLHTESDFRGSGIGLSIVKKVVESHQGFVWAEGKPGHGSTFSLLLPS